MFKTFRIRTHEFGGVWLGEAPLALPLSATELSLLYVGWFWPNTMFIDKLKLNIMNIVWFVRRIFLSLSKDENWINTGHFKSAKSFIFISIPLFVYKLFVGSSKYVHHRHIIPRYFYPLLFVFLAWSCRTTQTIHTSMFDLERFMIITSKRLFLNLLYYFQNK